MKIAFVMNSVYFLFCPDEILQILSALSPKYWSTLSALPQSYQTVRDIQEEKMLPKDVSHLLSLLHSLSYQGKVKKACLFPDKNSLQQGDKLVCSSTCWERAMTQHYSLPELTTQIQMDYLISNYLYNKDHVNMLIKEGQIYFLVNTFEGHRQNWNDKQKKFDYSASSFQASIG